MSTYVNINTQIITLANTTTGSAAGRVLFTNGPMPAYLNSVMANGVTTATVGNRVYSIKINDTTPLPVIQSNINGTIAASSSWILCAMSGVQSGSVSGESVVAIPNQCLIPPNGTVVFFDVNNVDVNDPINNIRLVIQN